MKLPMSILLILEDWIFLKKICWKHQNPIDIILYFQAWLRVDDFATGSTVKKIWQIRFSGQHFLRLRLKLKRYSIFSLKSWIDCQASYLFMKLFQHLLKNNSEILEFLRCRKIQTLKVGLHLYNFLIDIIITSFDSLYYKKPKYFQTILWFYSSNQLFVFVQNIGLKTGDCCVSFLIKQSNQIALRQFR